jgi:predicted nucleic acid-binding protein
VSYLLDMNVLSEVRKASPEPAVAGWFGTVAGSELYLSVLVVGEIRQGVERLRGRDPVQAAVFDRWLSTLQRDFEDRILPVTGDIAEAWGRLNAPAPLPAVDSLLAATALVHGLTFVTRETQRLERTGVPLLNPWS